MKIVICGSMRSSKKMLKVGEALEQKGHQVVLPKFTKEYSKMDSEDEMHLESAKNKIEHDLIRDYYNEIKNSDAVLVINNDKNGIKGYVGGNSFLEMGFAHILNKKIFLFNDIPEISYRDELEAMQPIVIRQDIDKIR